MIDRIDRIDVLKGGGVSVGHEFTVYRNWQPMRTFNDRDKAVALAEQLHGEMPDSVLRMTALHTSNAGRKPN